MHSNHPVSVKVFAGSILLLVFGWVLQVNAFQQKSVAPKDNLQQAQQQGMKTESEAKTPLDPQLIPILNEMAAAKVLHPRTVDEAKHAYLFYTKFEAPPEEVLRVENKEIPLGAGSIPIRLYASSNSGNLPVWVFFHGGGFVTGSLDTHDVPLRALANRCNCLIISVAYRLAPKNPFPIPPEDCYAATKWVANHAAEIGGDSSRIAVGGDGAGGNLAAVVALMARDYGGPHLVYQILIYPILDGTMSTFAWIESADPVLTEDAMRAKWDGYLPLGTDLLNPYISPVSARSLENLPPAFIIAVAGDPLRDDAEYYAYALKAAGVSTKISRYPNMIHGFFLMSGKLDAGKKALNEIADALQRTFRSEK
jgi:acetyl esterase